MKQPKSLLLKMAPFRYTHLGLILLFSFSYPVTSQSTTRKPEVAITTTSPEPANDTSSNVTAAPSQVPQQNEFKIPPLVLNLVNNSKVLQLELTATPKVLQLVLQLNKTLAADLNLPKEKPVTKIDIGFDHGPTQALVDVVSIPLMPFSEADESSKGKDHIQDLHFSKKDGVILPDTKQDYEMVSLDVAGNGSFISTRFTRPWLTCDDNDVQFSLETINIFWNINSDPSTIKPGQPKYEAQKATGKQTTSATTTLKPPTEATRTSSQNATSVEDFNATSATTNLTSTVSTTPEPEVEVLRSIQDLSFQGPVELNMGKLFGTSVSLLLQACRPPPPRGKKSLDPLYNCTFSEYSQRQSLHSPLKIYGLAPLPSSTGATQSKNTSSSTSASPKQSFFAEHDFQPCPSSKEFEDIANALSRPLTGIKGKESGRSGGSCSYISLVDSGSVLFLLNSVLMPFLFYGGAN